MKEGIIQDLHYPSSSASEMVPQMDSNSAPTPFFFLRYQGNSSCPIAGKAKSINFKPYLQQLGKLQIYPSVFVLTRQ